MPQTQLLILSAFPHTKFFMNEPTSSNVTYTLGKISILEWNLNGTASIKCTRNSSQAGEMRFDEWWDRKILLRCDVTWSNRDSNPYLMLPIEFLGRSLLVQDFCLKIFILRAELIKITKTLRFPYKTLPSSNVLPSEITCLGNQLRNSRIIIDITQFTWSLSEYKLKRE